MFCHFVEVPTCDPMAWPARGCRKAAGPIGLNRRLVSDPLGKSIAAMLGRIGSLGARLRRLQGSLGGEGRGENLPQVRLVADEKLRCDEKAV